MPGLGPSLNEEEIILGKQWFTFLPASFPWHQPNQVRGTQNHHLKGGGCPRLGSHYRGLQDRGTRLPGASPTISGQTAACSRLSCTTLAPTYSAHTCRIDPSGRKGWSKRPTLGDPIKPKKELPLSPSPAGLLMSAIDVHVTSLKMYVQKSEISLQK